MIVFVDESGDSGFKIGKGSSKYFVICFILFEYEDDARRTENAIISLKDSLRKHRSFEFKFNKSSIKETDFFFKHLYKYKFKILAVVFDKEKIYDTKVRNKLSFIYFAFQKALEIFLERFIDAKFRLDGFREKSTGRGLKIHLRRNIREFSKHIHDIKFRNSKSDSLIQLADMYAGLIKKSYEANDRKTLFKTNALKKVEVVEYI